MSLQFYLQSGGPNTPLCERVSPSGAQGDPSALRLCPPLCLQGFYDQVANPLLVDVELLYPPDTVSALTQHRHKQYYEGSEIMVAGRIADHKLGSFKADVLARGVNGGLWSGEVWQHAEGLNPPRAPPCFPPSLSSEGCPHPCTMPPPPHPRPERSRMQTSPGWAAMGPKWPDSL